MTTTSRLLRGITAAALTAALSMAITGCAASGRAAGAPGGSDATTSGATCEQQTAFSLSLASDTGGRPTPLEAAQWFVQHGGVAGLPDGDWNVTELGKHQATVTSGATKLHVIKGSDGTWQVDSGVTCG